jgi:hypothetical protein
MPGQKAKNNSDNYQNEIGNAGFWHVNFSLKITSDFKRNSLKSKVPYDGTK